jgi:alkyl hydroperoxide reductase subunit D
MALDVLRAALPDYAKDTKLNLGSILGNSKLPAQLLWGAVLACAVTARNATVLRELGAEAGEHLSPEAVTAAKGAASVMAMNNIYYRGKHLISDREYDNVPARLRMGFIGNPGVDKTDFEFWCFAVSAIGGCGVCLDSHEKVLREAGLDRETIHEGLRIAAVVNAAAVTMGAEEALAAANA